MAGRDDSDEIDDEDGEWRFSLSDLDDEDEAQSVDGESDTSEGSGVAGSFAPSETIEPGEIDRENALFVLVGVAIGLGAIAAYALALL